jgi:hypothetical protein
VSAYEAVPTNMTTATARAVNTAIRPRHEFIIRSPFLLSLSHRASLSAAGEGRELRE